jgi:hypothetical protein
LGAGLVTLFAAGRPGLAFLTGGMVFLCFADVEWGAIAAASNEFPPIPSSESESTNRSKCERTLVFDMGLRQDLGVNSWRRVK